MDRRQPDLWSFLCAVLVCPLHLGVFKTKCRSPIAGSSALSSSFQDSRTVVLKSVLFLKSCSSNLDCPGGSDGKVSAYNAGDPGSIPESGRFPWRRKWQTHSSTLAWRIPSMEGYSPWGRKESHTTEQLHFHFSANLWLMSISPTDMEDESIILRPK